MTEPKKSNKAKATDVVDSKNPTGGNVNVESLVTDKSIDPAESLVASGALASTDPSIISTELDSPSPSVNAEKLVEVEPLVTTASLAPDKPLATANPLTTGDASDNDNDSGAGTMVPNEGNDVKISDQSNPQKKTIVIFLGPYQRYSRGDKAGFSADYAETLVARKIACWPKDFATKSKGNSHGYDFAI